MPPMGGAPNSSASSRKPKRARASSLEMPIRPKRRSWTDCWCIRIEPPAASWPLRTRSYAFALALPGSDSRSGRSSSRGAVNGWWTASQRFSSSFHSTRGKSITQAKTSRSSGISLNLRARSTRSRPRTVAATGAASPTRSRRSPAAAAVAESSRSCTADRNLATGELTPSGVTLIQTSPLAPACFASAVRSSSSLRDIEPAPETRSALTAPPLATTWAKAWNSPPAKSAETSASSIANRKSGLSEPKRAMASS